MIGRRKIALLAAVAAALAGAGAGAGASGARATEAGLRWGIKKGETLRYRVTTEQRTTHTGAMEDPVETAQRVRIVWRLTAHEIGIDGRARVSCRYDEVAVDMDQLALGRIVWDSTKKEDQPKAEDPAIKPFAALVGQEFSFALAPDGAVTELAGFDKVMKDVLAGLEDNPIAVSAITAGFGEEAARAALERAFAVVPEKAPVPEGATWSRASEQAVPTLGTLRFESDYKLVALKDGVAEIDAAVRLGATPRAAGEGEGVAQWLRVDFEGGGGTGKLSFAENRHLERGEWRLEMKVRSAVTPPVAPAEGPGAAADRATVRQTVVVERVP